MILSRFFAATPDNPRFSLNDPQAWDVFLGGEPAATGVRVTRETSLTYAPWYRGTNLIGNGVSKLPLLCYKMRPSGKSPDRKHPSWRLVRRKPNEFMTASTFKKLLTCHAVTEGNGYAYIDRLGDGRPNALLPLDPNQVTPARENGKLLYVVDMKTERRKVAAENMFHIKGFSSDGLVGYSVFHLARESLGLGIGARKYGAVFFRNNARPNVAIQVPKMLTDTQLQDMRKGWDSMQAGLENAHRIAVIQGGAELKTFSISAKDSQLLETRQFEIREMALWFGLPPHKLGDSSKASYNSLEQENQDYVDSGLDPWLATWEDECWDKLLTEEEKNDETHEFFFQRKNLVRASRADRGNYFKAATGGRAWMTPDEVRDEEDMELQGGDAAELRDPLNIDQGGDDTEDGDSPPAPKPPKPPKLPKKPADDEAKGEATLSAVRGVLEDAARRMARRLGNEANVAAKKPAAFVNWLSEVRNDHVVAITEAFTPASAFVDVSAGELAEWLVGEACERLLNASGTCKASGLAETIASCVAELQLELPSELARKFAGE